MKATRLSLVILAAAVVAGLALSAASAPAGAPPAKAALVPPTPPAGAAKGFAFKDTAGQFLDVFLDGRAVARYMYAFDDSTGPKRDETYKPFLHLFDAEGKSFITKGAGGYYTHHRGIFYGWQGITYKGKKGINIWEMGDGNQVHQKFSAQKADADQATFTSVIAWKLKDGTTLLEEERTFTFHRATAPTLALIDFVSKLKAVAGDVVLDTVTNAEHGGVHFRAADEKEGLDKKATKFLYPAATDWQPGDPGKISKIVGPWAAMDFTINGTPYCAEEMSSPENPKKLEWSAYRDYARFGVFFPGSEVKDGQVFTLACRFWVTTGKTPTREEFQAKYDAFTKGDKAK
jgi:hypothetical protein